MIFFPPCKEIVQMEEQSKWDRTLEIGERDMFTYCS